MSFPASFALTNASAGSAADARHHACGRGGHHAEHGERAENRVRLLRDAGRRRVAAHLPAERGKRGAERGAAIRRAKRGERLLRVNRGALRGGGAPGVSGRRRGERLSLRRQHVLKRVRAFPQAGDAQARAGALLGGVRVGGGERRRVHRLQDGRRRVERPRAVGAEEKPRRRGGGGGGGGGVRRTTRPRRLGVGSARRGAVRGAGPARVDVLHGIRGGPVFVLLILHLRLGDHLVLVDVFVLLVLGFRLFFLRVGFLLTRGASPRRATRAARGGAARPRRAGVGGRRGARRLAHPGVQEVLDGVEGRQGLDEDDVGRVIAQTLALVRRAAEPELERPRERAQAVPGAARAAVPARARRRAAARLAGAQAHGQRLRHRQRVQQTLHERAHRVRRHLLGSRAREAREPRRDGGAPAVVLGQVRAAEKRAQRLDAAALQ